MMRDLDSEERGTLALGAMAALEDLITGRAPGLPIDAETFGCLIRGINMIVKEAIRLPVSAPHPLANDD